MTASAPVLYRDRETGRILSETVYKEAGVRFLYETLPGRWTAELLLKRAWVSRFYGWFQRTRRSRKKIKRFVRALGIDPAEAERPLEAYGSFDDFFVRRLKPEARPIDFAADHLLRPADGRVLVYPSIHRGGVKVKGGRLTLKELLADPALAERYHEGSVVVVRLAPPDYHRFHFPDDGAARASRWAGRGLHSVNPIALASGAKVFRNRRAVVMLASRNFGAILLVPVGAIFVGSIALTFSPGEVRRGDEMGYFHFGGSTLVMVLEKGRVQFDEDLLRSSAEDLETFLKMGQRIGRRREIKE